MRKIFWMITMALCLMNWALAEALPEESGPVIPAVEAIPVVEGTPLAEATPAPEKPEPISDRERIRQAQQSLIDLGYLEGGADGIAGKQTKKAVKAFQEKHGMAATGVLDEATFAAIAASVPASVREVQQRLIDLGYLEGTADGKWGGRSTAAMKLFQQLHDLNVTGETDEMTTTRLFQEDAIALPPSLRSGASGEAVTKLQMRLGQFGFYTDAVSGSYDKSTVSAVKAFQQRLIDQELAQAFDITATGEATPMTQHILFNSGYSTYLKDVGPGEVSDEVRRIEGKLNKLGYMDAEADDTFDDYALQALDLFKTQAGVLTFGGADQPTIDALFSENAPQAARPVWRNIASGDTGRTVETAEAALIQGGMLVKLANGKYDKDMEKAVERLHTYLTDRKSDDAALFEDTKALTGEAVAALYGGLLDYVSDVGGDKSDAAETLRVQRRLYGLYFLPKIGVDGLMGGQSRDAIKEFQSTNGLEVTGTADRATQEILFSDEALDKRFPYRIHVNLGAQRVEVYALNAQNQYDQVQDFICSTGLHDATPHGTFLEGRPLDRWHYFEKFYCWAQYAYQIEGDILFHSVIYGSRDAKNPTSSSVRNLGRPASHGCVRLQVEDAKWIYEHCKKGTTLITID